MKAVFAAIPLFPEFCNALIGPIGPAKIAILTVVTVVYWALWFGLIPSVDAIHWRKKSDAFQGRYGLDYVCSDKGKQHFKETLKDDYYYQFLQLIKVLLYAITGVAHTTLFGVAISTAAAARFTPVYAALACGLFSIVCSVSSLLLNRFCAFLCDRVSAIIISIKYSYAQTNRDYAEYGGQTYSNRKKREI